MKLIPALVLTISILSAGTAHSMEKSPEVVKKKNGLYESTIEEGTFVVRYFVDTETQLCYGGHISFPQLVPCQNLKKRKEWQGIISW